MLKHNNLFFKLFFWLLIITVLSFSLFACDYLEIAEPTIQYYEFPIRIEYKIKNLTEDEVIVIEDTLICEYKGILKKPIYLWFDYGPPHERVWDGRVNYTHSDDVNYILYSNYKTTVAFVLGDPGYYMGDSDYYTDSCYPHVFGIWEIDDNGAQNWTTLSTKELEKYGIEIVDYTLPEPIENIFQ